MNRREAAAAATRSAVLEWARTAFIEQGFEAVTMRDIARLAGLSTGAIFAHFTGKAELYAAAIGWPHPWLPIALAPRKGELCLLLVDYTEATNSAEIAATPGDVLWTPAPVEDAEVGRTIGHNNFENDGVDAWQFSGWCWSHDHYTQGRGTPVAFIRLDDVAPEASA